MSSSPGRAFWLCHECGAQMRPIRVDGVRKCASCSGEFIEILDEDVNPDPWHQLPPEPPTRPGAHRAASPPDNGFTNPYFSAPPPRPGANRAPSSSNNRPTDPYFSAPPSAGVPGMLGSMLSSFLSGTGQGGDETHPHANQRDTPATAGGSNDGPFGRTYQFNIGNGSGSVTFGSFGAGGSGGRGGMGGFGPFGPIPHQGGDQGGGLDAFFPGFPPPPPHHGQGFGREQVPGQEQGGQHMQAPDLMRALMGILGDEGIIYGPQGRMNVGDYVTSDHGFNQILEHLMQATGPQGPIPATDAVIEGLPRSKLDEESIAKSTFKDCPVCKDDFEPGDEIMRVPCEHVFHVDCLQPWLKTNGSCPVCRFSLVPDDSNGPPRSLNQPTQSQASPGSSYQGASPSAAPGTPATPGFGGSSITNMLQRLWGQSGSTSHPSSPTTENPPAAQAERMYDPPSYPPPGAQQASSAAETADRAATGHGDAAAIRQEEARLPSDIPEDYRERHRQREREQSGQRERDPYVDDLD